MTATLDRREAVAELLKDRGDLLVVTGLGSPTYDAAAAGDDARNFYLWGAMGGAAVMVLGLALAQPQRPVLCLTGDGEMLMGLGSLATIGVQRPANLTIAVIDNEQYGETGQQASHTGGGVDIAGVAEACGFASVARLTTLDEVAAYRPRLRSGEGPGLAVLKVAAGEQPRVLPPRDAVYLKHRFREAVLGVTP